MSGKRVILTGATGMVGGCALRSCLENPDVSMVTAIGRRSTGMKHPKLREVEHDNFRDFSSISEKFRDQDVALFCLGVYTGAVPDNVFREITIDYTVAFASALYKESPQVSFCFLSGQGQTRRRRAVQLSPVTRGLRRKPL
jgi:nucleoside-diphosphate-sugar epimerase